MPKTTAERLAILETKVTAIEANAIEIKNQIQELNRELVQEIKEMREESTEQHTILAGKVDSIDQTQKRWRYVITGGTAVLAFLLGQTDLAKRLLDLLL